MSEKLPYTAGTIVLAGGLFAYASKKSKPSLIAGTVIGSGLLASGYLISRGEKAGQYLAAALGSLLTVSMGRRATTLAPVPVVLTAIGATVAANHIWHIYENK
mmetsp:Transcript_113354/g.169514  ORF Transcript_113354/g.169514 Transcript_113354/m.169514 type:complete len:103 (+) Transcript_113354:28-336(+)